MALEYSTASEFGFQAPDFCLPGVDGQTYRLESFSEFKGLLVVFMCNHCPYVIAVHERLNQLAREFIPKGIQVIGINSNDPLYKEADSFENMKIRSREWDLVFPYVFDESQGVARAYDAVCTPDPYLFKQQEGVFRLVYRGRLDDSWKDPAGVTEESLRDAMKSLLEADAEKLKKGFERATPSMGCSIKWKELTAQKLAEKATTKQA